MNRNITLPTGFALAFKGVLHHLQSKMVGAFAFVERHLDEITFGFEARNDEMIERVQSSGCALNFITEATE